MKRLIMTCNTGIALATASVAALAQTTVRIGSIQSESFYMNKYMEKFQEIVRQKTNNAYQFKVFYNSTLGNESEMFEQMQAGLPLILLLVLITWVFLLFIGLGLIAPRNSTAAIALLACALSMSGAIFLIVELTRPLDGWIQVSKLPVVRALQMISK